MVWKIKNQIESESENNRIDQKAHKMLTMVNSIQINAFAFPIEAVFLICYKKKAEANLRRAQRGKLKKMFRRIRSEKKGARGSQERSILAKNVADSSNFHILKLFSSLFFELSKKFSMYNK